MLNNKIKSYRKYRTISQSAFQVKTLMNAVGALIKALNHGKGAMKIDNEAERTVKG